MTHLSRDELVRWRDEGREADRERVVGHLASCDACGGAYAELIWTAPPAAGPPRLDEAAFRARGYDPRRTGWSPLATGPRPALLAAALAVLAIAGTLFLSRAPSEDSRFSDTAVRGSSIQPLAPVGAVSGPVEFRWASPIVAARFVLEVKDAQGHVVGTAHTETERVSDPSLDGRLVAGERYFWMVTALDRDGAALIRSPPQAFVRDVRP